MKKIYVDYGATTPVDPEVFKEMLPYFDKFYGNPASLHSYGRIAFKAVENARKQVANMINADSDEIVFTSGGTESDNFAIKGLAYNYNIKTSRYHIITSAIEHPAVIETCKYLEKKGYNITYLPVDKYGLIDLDDLENAITKDTILITIMYANNVIGTIEPIEEIGKIAQKHDIIFHTDAVQAIGKTPVDVNKLNVDLLSISSHKIYGPKGMGALYIKKGVKLQTIAHGGGHERELRSGTLNTPGIVGLGKACELGKKRLIKDTKHLKKLRDTLIKNVLKIEQSFLNGHPEKRLVNNAHFRFTAIEGESLNLRLDEKGIEAATGSACSSRKLETSPVLLALGLNPEEAHGNLRFSLGRMNTIEDIEYISNILPEVVCDLRKMSPLWNR